MVTRYIEIRDRLRMESKRIREELTHLHNSISIDGSRDESQSRKREEEATDSLEMGKRLAMENGLNGLLWSKTRRMPMLFAL